MVPLNSTERPVAEARYIEDLVACPWCGDGSTPHRLWCSDPEPFKTVQCGRCGMVYLKTRLNDEGREERYRSYYTSVHQSREELTEKREAMYAIERRFVERYAEGGHVLDVGCSGGNFLAHFNSDRWDRWGVEFGQEAADEARRRIGSQVLRGALTELELPRGFFDLIIFRGVIEHVSHPKTYLERSIELLAPKGKVFITSTPNRDSICADLFRERWNQHSPAN